MAVAKRERERRSYSEKKTEKETAKGASTLGSSIDSSDDRGQSGATSASFSSGSPRQGSGSKKRPPSPTAHVSPDGLEPASPKKGRGVPRRGSGRPSAQLWPDV